MQIEKLIFRLPDVQAAVGLKREQIRKLERDGRFPKRFRIAGTTARGWCAKEVRQWVADQVAAPRDGGDQ